MECVLPCGDMINRCCCYLHYNSTRNYEHSAHPYFYIVLYVVILPLPPRETPSVSSQRGNVYGVCIEREKHLIKYNTRPDG